MKKISCLFRLIPCIIMTIFVLGCGYYSDDELDVTAGKSAFPDYEYNQERAQLLSDRARIAISESGYYYIMNDILYFYDINNSLNMPLCSRVNCNHSSSECDAYVYTTSSDPDASYACNCMDKKIFYYNNSLYLIERTEDSDFYLCKYDDKFNNRQVISKLASISDEKTMVSDADISRISDGYLYYFVTINNPEYAKNDFMALFQCRRIKLEKNAVPEIFVEFEFPGDYATSLGDSQGLKINVCDENIYYIAGGTERCRSSNNPVQYKIFRYNTSDGLFENIWSIAGNTTENIFGDNTGKVSSFSSGDYIISDNDRNMYILMSTKKDGLDRDKSNCILKLNIENNAAEIIYESSDGNIQPISYDGKNILFFEVEERINTPSSSFYTAIDCDGNVISRYELEYIPEYLNEYSSYVNKVKEKGMEVATPSATDRNIIVFCCDDRYILIGCYATVDVFKNLSSSNYKSNHINLNSHSEQRIVGVGLLPQKQFMDSEPCEIKQIYQYAP